MNDKILANELRCLRMHLAGFVVKEKLELIEEAERRLKGDVSTTPATTPKAKRGSQGNRTTKKTAYNHFLNK
jgi:hypothetical protein